MMGSGLRAAILSAVMACSLIGCGSDGSGGTAGTGGGDSNGTGGADGNASEPIGFVFSELGFHGPEDRNVGVDGFDLDGRASTADNPQTDECAHNDFTSTNGEPGIDYRMLNIMDLLPSLGPGQFVDNIAQEAIKNGEMTVLMELSGVDDMQNDDDVQVQIFSSEDVPPRGPGGVLPGGSLTAHSDDSLNSDVVSGRIEDGVLTVGPIDLLLDFNIQVVDLQLSINRAWIRLDLGADEQSGVFAGFWPVAEIRTSIADPTTRNGAELAGFSKADFEAAMLLADGDFNGEICESISMMFEFEVVRAFVVK